MSQFIVQEPTSLITFLILKFPEMKKNTIKNRLRDSGFTVNDNIETKATLSLAIGDKVSLVTTKTRYKTINNVEILFVCKEFVVVNKPSGILSVPSPNENERTVLSSLKSQLPKQSFFACHRIDKGTSGLLLIPRTKKVQEFFFTNWSKVEKTYIAVVEGRIEKDSGTINKSLLENPNTLSVSVSNHPNARDAISHYKVLSRGTNKSLVEIKIETGRKHQIRVHMQHLGHPIIGDERYSSINKTGRIFLHAHKLQIPHPTSEKLLSYEAPIPLNFLRWFQNKNK